MLCICLGTKQIGSDSFGKPGFPETLETTNQPNKKHVKVQFDWAVGEMSTHERNTSPRLWSLETKE